MPPAPPGVAGLREWRVILPGEGDLYELRARLRRAGVVPGEADGGVTVRDPWDHRLRVAVEAR